jgi:hypothetical protein
LTVALVVAAVTLVGIVTLLISLPEYWTYGFFSLADMSPALFQHFSSLGTGVISIKWEQA